LSILFSIFVNNLLPVFLVIGVGFLLGLTLRPDVKAVSRTTFYALTPCLIFSGLTNTPLSGAQAGQVALFAALATLFTAAVAWLAASVLRWKGHRRRVLVLPVLVINTGNFGLSVVLFAFGPDAQARAMIYFVTTAVMAASVGVAFAAGGGSLGKVLSNLVRIPLLWAAVSALVVGASGIQVPDLFMRPIKLLGGGAVPMMLVILGMQLAYSMQSLRSNVGSIVLASALRLLVAPILAIPVAWITGVAGLTYQACMLEASMPSGVTSTVIALEYDLDPDVVTGTVFFSTLLSALTLAVVISLIRMA
jgi:predicted permease